MIVGLEDFAGGVPRFGPCGGVLDSQTGPPGLLRELRMFPIFDQLAALQAYRFCRLDKGCIREQNLIASLFRAPAGLRGATY